MADVIPYGRQAISEDDIQAVVDVLRSDFLTQGAVAPSFEKMVAEYCGVDHAVAVNSATSALHIACLALGLGEGDCLWTSPNTFVASANCALYCGADIDFVDIDAQTYNLCVNALEKKLIDAKKKQCLPKVVVPVHFSGQSCDMRRIYELSLEYGFKIIEDAAHAIGGKYLGDPIGNCRYSDITIFSFHPVKIITSGEGGMALTHSHELADRMRLFRSHGITSDAHKMDARPHDEMWNYQQITLGLNYRMTDIHAALGMSQMTRLDEFVAKRHQIADLYDEVLAELPIQTPWQHPDTYSSYHLYPIRLTLNEVNKTQRQVYGFLRAENILVNLHYIPVYRQPYYEQRGFKQGYCPNAEQYYREALSIPMYPSLTEQQQGRVLNVLQKALKS